ncbi:hypothetical protein PoB_001690300 [Plakobranchus ocellatus]|uniref:Uncharacterized protein n=1 Tax=Plakobranchus ocellatus TaxID=259542 RepID=A0AAV3Z7F1_9GAST|nr:hypothetical protein PoB_001690300 [Plakobranchus ocellatus]
MCSSLDIVSLLQGDLKLLGFCDATVSVVDSNSHPPSYSSCRSLRASASHCAFNVSLADHARGGKSDIHTDSAGQLTSLALGTGSAEGEILDFCYWHVQLAQERLEIEGGGGRGAVREERRMGGGMIR